MSLEFVSYPKSGRSWLRYMLNCLSATSTVSFHHDGFEFNDGSRPPHSYDMVARHTRYRAISRLVYLERDPRDVMVSLFHQITGRYDREFGYRGSLSQFIRDSYFGAEVLQRFRAMWAELASEYGFLTITYEQLHRDPREVLVKVLDYYGFVFPNVEIDMAVEGGGFNAMRELELSNRFPEPWLRLRQGHPKVREGRVGAYLTRFSSDDVGYLDSVFHLEAKS